MNAESTAAGNKEPAHLCDEQVIDYLRQHRDFFERHPDMLDHLHISHGTGSAVSLVEKRVSILRERNTEIRRRLNSLAANARDNDRLYDSTRNLVLALLDAGNQDDLGGVFAKAMEEQFSVQHASLILFGDPAHGSEQLRVESIDSARIEIGALLKNREPTCGVLREEELVYLFPGAADIGSAAVVPLRAGHEIGVFAVGNNDASYYSSNMGTLFLSHIADVLVRLLPRMAQAGP